MTAEPKLLIELLIGEPLQKMPKEIWFVFIGAKDAQKVFPPGLPTVVAMLLLNCCP
jgi:hypothetical protein